MFQILSDEDVNITLPKNLGMETMYGVIRRAITDAGDARGRQVNFDFSRLEFVESVGVVVLSNLIEYLRKCGCQGRLHGIFRSSKAVCYLDDSNFFTRYNGAPLREHAHPRDGTFPLTLVADTQAIGFLYQTLVPWLATQLGTREEALASIRVCIEEILQNIGHHSGVDVGCFHAQHFPNNGEIHIAISDFGYGIPHNVRKVNPEATDSEALRLACQEGFTTQSNVQNRGAGLSVLLNIVTSKDRGKVWIVSGKGNVSCIHIADSSKLTARTKQFVYPGTLVLVILKTAAVQDLARDVEQEDFSW